MLAEILTVSIALGTVLVQLVFAIGEYNFNCDKYLRYLKNKEEDLELREMELATTIEAIKEVDCSSDVMRALTL